MANTKTRRELILAAGAACELYLAWLDADAGSKNCGTGAGGFQPGNTCGRLRRHGRGHGKHRRSHQRSRKVRGPEHADWLGHQARERREHARDLRADRRALREEHRAERRTLRRQQERDVAKLRRDQDREAASLARRHGREASRAKDPAAPAARHAAERDGLAADHAQERDDLAGEHAADRRALRDEQREAAADQRREMLDGIREFREGQRTEMAEVLRDIRDRRQYEREQAEGVKAAPAWQSKSDEDDVPDADRLLALALANRPDDEAEAFASGELDGRLRLDLLHELRSVCRAWLRRHAEAFLAGVRPGVESKALSGSVRDRARAFFGRARKFLRSAILAGALTLFGPGPLDDRTLAGVDRQVSAQVAYLDAFEAATLDGTQPIDGTAASRAELYGGQVWGSALNLQRERMEGTAKEERRVHRGPDVPCATCREQVGLGWVPYGTLRPLGDSPCRTNCHCVFEFR